MWEMHLEVGKKEIAVWHLKYPLSLFVIMIFCLLIGPVTALLSPFILVNEAYRKRTNRQLPIVGTMYRLEMIEKGDMENTE